MPRRKKEEPLDLIEVPLEPENGSVEDTLPVNRPIERLSFKVTDGKLDISSLRETTRRRAEEVLRNSVEIPEFRSAIGLDERPSTGLVTPALVHGTFNAIAQVEVMVFSKKFPGLNRKTVAEVVQWSASEHAYLDEQGAILANKYIPASWLKYADLVIFGTNVLLMLQMKLQTLERLSMIELEKIKAAKSHDEAESVAV